MKRPGQIAILRFPHADLHTGKPRPVLLVAPVPGPYDDWLVCMISTQIQQAVADFDEVIDESDEDFHLAGIKVKSAVRIGRLAVASADVLEGAIGAISAGRLERIRKNLSRWIGGES